MPDFKQFYCSDWRTANSQIFKPFGALNPSHRWSNTKLQLPKRRTKCWKEMRKKKKKKSEVLRNTAISAGFTMMFGDEGATAIKWAIKWSTVNMWTLKRGKKKIHTSTLHLSISTTLQPYCWHGTITISLLEQTSVRF